MQSRFRLGAGTFIIAAFAFSSAWATAGEGECFFEPGEELENPGCYIIGNIEMSTVEPDPGMEAEPMRFLEEPIGVSGTPAELAEIFSLMRELWKFIEDNKPIKNLDLQVFTAVTPAKEPLWTELERWHFPPQTSSKYIVSFKNLYGIEVIRFNYFIMYTYGGQYEGEGHYLANVAVVPDDVKVRWGFTLNATAEVPMLINFGTKDDPIAGMQMLVNWKVDSVMGAHEGTRSYVFAGDGRFSEIGGKLPTKWFAKFSE